MTEPQGQSEALPLFAADHAENGDRLFEQYRMLVASADAISERRYRTHGLFLTTNAGVLALFGTTVERFPWYTSLLILLAGVLIAATWASLIDRYRTLNAAKFKIIHEVERYLPLRMFSHEWVLLKQADGTLHKPLGSIEKNIPFVVMALYCVLAVLLLFSSL